MDILSFILAQLLGKAGGDFLDRILGHLERQADSETERQKIAAARQAQGEATAARVVMAGMAHWPFWIPWLMAAVPLMAWFGWGVLDTLFNGALPDVATLPPQLKTYADIVFGNVFYSGAALGGAQMIAGALTKR